jgi:proteasome lid subunit RPN8/RPN11
MSLYDPVDHWHLPNSVLPDSIAEMAPDGKRGCEGIVLWLGTVRQRIATVTHLVGLHGPQVVKWPDHLRISPDLFNKVTNYCERVGATLIGQIHSHPGTFIDLSEADKRYGISAPHFLSVVAPHYAQRPQTEWSHCGVHVFDASAGFVRLSRQQVGERIHTITNVRPPLTHLR